MSKPRHQDPEVRAKKAERRKRRKAHEAAGRTMLPPKPRPTAQMDHASNPKSTRKAREGEHAMDQERATE